MKKLKAVFTDALTIGGTDLGPLRDLCELTCYDLTSPEETLERVRDCEVIFSNKTPITREIICSCPGLRYIGVFATGYNNIDIEAARERGVAVCNAGTYSTSSVAQLVFAFILEHYSKPAAYSGFVAGGGWVRSPMFTALEYPTYELEGKTLGIVGYGAIGRKVASIAKAFGMNVIVYTRTRRDMDVEYCGFDDLLARSDVITVHCPLNESSRNMFNKDAFSKMKSTAMFINTSRGGTVCEHDLRDALDSGRIACAAVDVAVAEPMSAGCELLSARNIMITPHVGWAPEETRVRLVNITVDNFRTYLEGGMKNRIV